MTLRKDVFDAVANIVKDHGFSKLSISLIAEYADMESVVIYRNFTNVENILEQYIERLDYWLSFFSKEEDKDKQFSKDFYINMLEELLDLIHRKKEIQQLIVWELSEDNNFTRTLAGRRELGGEALMNNVEEYFKDTGLDVNIISAIVISAIYYLSVHKDRSTFCGIDMNGRIGKERLRKGIEQIVDWIFDIKNKTKEKNIAKKLMNDGVSEQIIMNATGLSEKELNELKS